MPGPSTAEEQPFGMLELVGVLLMQPNQKIPCDPGKVERTSPSTPSEAGFKTDGSVLT
jgi:hypothetical protein